MNALKNRHFLALVSGRFVSNIGDSLYAIAAMWLVFELSGSSFYTGLAGAVVMLPTMFEFLLGPLVDKWPLKPILVHTQWIQAVLLLVIPVGHYVGVLNVWIVIVTMFVVASIEQLSFPAQNATIPKLLPESQLVSGNSLMAFAYQGTDIVFMGAAGLLITMIGAVHVYTINSVTFMIATILFTFISLPKEKKDQEDIHVKENAKSYLQELVEGKDFVMGSLIPKILVPDVIANFLFGMVTAIMPVYANYVGGERYYGYFLAAMSICVLIGSVLANYVTKIPMGWLNIGMFFVAGICWYISYGFAATFPILSVIFFGLAFIPVGITNVVLTSTLQRLIPEDKIGRVFSWYSSIPAALLPLGSLLGGGLASIYGSEVMMAAGGIGFLLTTLYWLINKNLRTLTNPEQISKEDLKLEDNEEKQPVLREQPLNSY